MCIANRSKASNDPVGTNRPSALIVKGDAPLLEAFAELLRSTGSDASEAFRQALVSQGYDVVVVSSAEEAQHLLRQRLFDRIYSGDGALLGLAGTPQEQIRSGPKVEDLGDGTAHVQIDQVVPWWAAVEILDTLADAAPDKPQLSS